MIVVDTNVLVHFLVSGVHSEAARRVYTSDPDWVAPLLWRSELRNTLSQFIRRNLMTLAEAKFTMDYAEEIVGRHMYFVDSQSVLELTAKSGCTAYDCEFVVLAMQLSVPLVTCDGALLAAFPTVARTMEDYLA